MKDNIEKYRYIFKNIFSMVEENDTIYIASAFPSDLDYKIKKTFSNNKIKWRRERYIIIFNY